MLWAQQDRMKTFWATLLIVFHDAFSRRGKPSPHSVILWCLVSCFLLCFKRQPVRQKYWLKYKSNDFFYFFTWNKHELNLKFNALFYKLVFLKWFLPKERPRRITFGCTANTCSLITLRFRSDEYKRLLMYVYWGRFSIIFSFGDICERQSSQCASLVFA